MMKVPIEIDEENLSRGLLGLVVALVEVIKDVLQGQAMRRMEGGSLTEEEINRLGEALMDLEEAIETIKREHGLDGVVRDVRDGLDEIASDVVRIMDPVSWGKTIPNTQS